MLAGRRASWPRAWACPSRPRAAKRLDVRRQSGIRGALRALLGHAPGGPLERGVLLVRRRRRRRGGERHRGRRDDRRPPDVRDNGFGGAKDRGRGVDRVSCLVGSVVGDDGETAHVLVPMPGLDAGVDGASVGSRRGRRGTRPSQGMGAQGREGFRQRPVQPRNRADGRFTAWCAHSRYSTTTRRLSARRQSTDEPIDRHQPASSVGSAACRPGRSRSGSGCSASSTLRSTGIDGSALSEFPAVIVSSLTAARSPCRRTGGVGREPARTFSTANTPSTLRGIRASGELEDERAPAASARRAADAFHRRRRRARRRAAAVTRRRSAVRRRPPRAQVRQQRGSRCSTGRAELLDPGTARKSAAMLTPPRLHAAFVGCRGPYALVSAQGNGSSSIRKTS